ncbi:MAG: sigma 54-interacting transcriptional regulator [Polyangiaceae bacterium]|nr:sigma 54-interacting transcriptional regulator [Polyangiaceae bacterium]
MSCHDCQKWQDRLVLLQVRKKPPPLGPELLALLERAPEPAILLTVDHRILASNAAYRAKYGEVASPGHPCYAASHGYDSPCDENGGPCPLRATLESGRRQRVFQIHQGATGPYHVDVELEPVLGVDGRVAYFLERIHEIAESPSRPRGELVGRAPCFLRALGLLQRAARSEVPVLVLGESGTGKELGARAVHQMSTRHTRPFMPVECSGLPETLFESELFGYEQGAFTGASKGKRGLVDATAGGTLFLDEIGDVPLAVQVKLLRLLESGTFRRVGGTEPQRADFRLVCATHRDLGAMVRAGTFRQDLFYRINAFPVVLPPVRERPSDIPLLCDAFLAQRHPSKRLHPDALARLVAHDWPGNVRELRNVVQRMALLADGEELLPEHLPPELAAARAPAKSAPRERNAFALDDVAPLDEVEAAYLRWALARRPDRAALARALGISERTLYRKLDEARRLAAQRPAPSDD